MAGSTRSEIPSQVGRSAVVTGATGGLGYETALALARAGADVILTGRDERKAQSAIEKIRHEATGARVSYERLDLASLASIADFAQWMGGRQSLDLLINNAGVMALHPSSNHGGRLRNAVRNEPSGSLRSHGPADALASPV
jgi:NAD(P)-dependent dehydrogenase (short-subunit alcohol dehydrogenase family)